MLRGERQRGGSDEREASGCSAATARSGVARVARERCCGAVNGEAGRAARECGAGEGRREGGEKQGEAAQLAEGETSPAAAGGGGRGVQLRACSARKRRAEAACGVEEPATGGVEVQRAWGGRAWGWRHGAGGEAAPLSWTGGRRDGDACGTGKRVEEGFAPGSGGACVRESCPVRAWCWVVALVGQNGLLGFGHFFFNRKK